MPLEHGLSYRARSSPIHIPATAQARRDPGRLPARIARAARRLTAALPQGRTLPEAVWRPRHRFMLAVIWVQLAGLAVAGVVIGRGAGSVALVLWPIVACALAGALPTGGRRLRGSMVAFAALYCSAALVDFSGGATEAHFSFFVMVAMLAAYEEWVPYLLAIAFVIVHHGLLGVLAPSLVYSSTSAIDSPWKWALIHAAFILALSAVSIVSWRLNENARAEAERAHERTRTSEAEFRGAFDDAPIGMAIVDLGGRFARVNRSLCELSGYDREQLLAMRLDDLVGLPAAEGRGEADSTARECPFRRAGGTSGWGLLQQSVVRGESGDERQILVQLLDLTQRKQAERQLTHAADHDGLTGLANRTCFERLAAEAIAEGGADACRALLFVDVDDFKSVNDSLGHGAGDSLLIMVASRLRGVLAPGDLLARFGGDEFVILLPDTNEREARATAARLRAVMNRPCDLAGSPCFITISIGLTMSAGSDASAHELIRDGDAAMYRAKAAGKDGVALFDEQLRSAARERTSLEDELRRALELGEFELHYQLEIDLDTRATFGVEALIRRRRADGTLVPPDDFIPVAEQSGMIVPIGRWVLDEACRQAAAWRAEDLLGDDSLMCVNLSARQLVDDSLAADVAAALERHGLPARLLCLEYTESAVMLDAERAGRALTELKALGVKLAIDDFGTGYSSVAQLGHLVPVDILKIDRSLVRGLFTGDRDAAAITAMVEIAGKLGVTIVAEGIEEVAQAERLRQLHCTVGQGYVIGHPQPAALAGAALARRRADRTANAA